MPYPHRGHTPKPHGPTANCSGWPALTLLDHSSYAITADLYSHVGPTLQREAADRLDQAPRW